MNRLWPYLLWAAAGCALCLWLDQSLFAGVVGVLFGVLWARLLALEKSLQTLRKRLEQPDASPSVASGEMPSVASNLSTRPARPDSYANQPTQAIKATESASAPSDTQIDTRIGTNSLADWRQLEQTAQGDEAVAAEPGETQRPDPLERLFKRIWAWFTTGNVPVKVGILVLFIGVAALLKYASDQGLFTAPISVRISGISAAALVALGFGWRQRKRRRIFALSVQGGAIGVLIMAVFAAFRLYDLLAPLPAFALLIVLVAGTGLLAVLQDSLSLAILGLIAGFAAPILISTEHGSHIVLFSYYVVLNLAILAIAWRRSWRVLNLLGFVATFGVGTVWGVLDYRPEFFASTEPFLVFNFLLYLIIPWLYLRHESARHDTVMDGCLLFGNPLASLLLQGTLLQWQGMELAISALVTAAIYVLAAWGMRSRVRMDILRDAWAVLAIAFATLAVPLALNASLTASVFALEGAGLVWLGFRQQRRLSRWGGLALQLYAGVALLISYTHPRAIDWMPIINRDFLGAMLIVAGSLASCRLYSRRASVSRWMTIATLTTCAWGMLWWLGATTTEIVRSLVNSAGLAALWMLAAITAWFVSEVARRTSCSPLGKVMAWTAMVLTALTLIPVAYCLLPEWQPFAGWLLLAVATTAVTGWRMLANLSAYRGPAVTTQLLWWWRWAFVAGVAILVALHDMRWLADAWRTLLALAPAVILWFVCMHQSAWLAAPLRTSFSTTRLWLLHSLTLLMALIFIIGLFAPGNAAPLPYVPLINPLELLLLAIAFGLMHWCVDSAAPTGIERYTPLLVGIGAMILMTSITLRAVHHLAGVAWGHPLATSSLAQMSLTIVWSVFGVLAWLWGSRKRQRAVWFAGAVMMGIVLFKLLVIDRTHLGNFFGIGSFIAYGLLCTIIGYFAPAPLRQANNPPPESSNAQ